MDQPRLSLYRLLWHRGAEIDSGGSVVAGTTSSPCFIGYYAASSGTVTVDGAASNWTTDGDLYVGYGGTGGVTQSGGAVSVGGTDSAKALYLGYTSTGNGTYNLNGGVLTVSGLAGGSGTAAFKFGGGTLTAGVSFASTLPMTLTNNGGDPTVNTNGYAVTLSGVLSNGTSVLGKLTKTGLGTLTLAGANTYSGVTTVKAGTLELASAAQTTVLASANGGADVQNDWTKLVFDYNGGTSPAASVKKRADGRL